MIIKNKKESFIKNIMDRFTFGTQIYRVPSLPHHELKQDIHTLRDLGFNSIKIQISWCIVEKVKGEIDLAEVEELIIEAKKVEMGVCLLMTMEQVPMWVWKKYPDCRLLNAKNEPHEDPSQYLLPSDGKPGPCWDHPGVRNEAEQFLSRTVRKLGKYNNIISWNVWQEIGFWEDQEINKLAEKTYCYCPYTLKRFREWLQKKYKNLDNLNDLWKTGFGKWKEVEPPRRFSMVPSWIDWKYFMNNVYIADILKWRKEVIQKNDTMQRPVMAHVDNPTFGSERDWAYAKEVDIFGTSFYPDWISFKSNNNSCSDIAGKNKMKLSQSDFPSFSMYFDYIQSTIRKNKEFCLGEFQGGPFSYGIYLAPEPSSEDIKRWLLIALSCGVKGLYFWNHRPDLFWGEMHGFGLCDWDGTPTDRAIEAGKISITLNRHKELFKQGSPLQSQIAIIVNEALYNFSDATPYALKGLQLSLKGWYQFLWKKGIWIDFISAKNILQGKLKNYKAAILPFPIALGNELAEVLKNYVSDGGMLISEACPGRVNEYGMANLSGLAKDMQELFGVEYKKLTYHQNWNDIGTALDNFNKNISLADFYGMGSYHAYTLKPSLFTETYKITKASPVLSSNQGISGAVNSYGQGKGILLGTLAGHMLTLESNSNNKCFISKIIEDYGFKPEKWGKLLRRRRAYKNREAWFLINNSDQTVTENIGIDGYVKVEDIFENKILDIIDNNIVVTVHPFSINCLVMSKKNESGETG